MRRLVVLVAIAITAIGGSHARFDPGTEPSLALSSDLRVHVRHGRSIELQVRVAAGDDWKLVAARVCGDPEHAAALQVLNADARIADGTWIRVPLALLSDGYRNLVLRAQFPDDERDGDAWVHRARSGVLPLYDEGLWQVAEWFVGRGDRFVELQRANGLSSPELRKGQPIRVPASLLHPAFRARANADGGLLEFGTDTRGPFAAYRLRTGEALYSSVVVRFTGRTGSADVVDLAGRIAERSDIRDTRDIPVGFEIKIPLDLLEPAWLPNGHPRRVEAERREQELVRALDDHPVSGGSGLDGVVVIIDPGHGGRDLGTAKHGIWEHDYVYDVACRLREMLSLETAADVVMTLEDRETGCAPSSGDTLKANRQGTILTDPPFLATGDGDATIGVNLRWYLSNSVFRKAHTSGTPPDRVVFLSLHADSRHPSLRGAMVYVPGAAYRTGKYGHSSKTYKRFAEVRANPYVTFSKKERLRSEAVSRKLGQALLTGLGGRSLPIQPYQPMRDKIIRGRKSWVPAVLRGNAVPTKVLVEMVNLSNPDDAALLASARKREALARGLLDGLYSHFGETPGTLAARTAAP